MADSGPKFRLLKFLKIISVSFGVLLLVLFTVASLRTLSLDVNAGLQLARWEKRNNISLAIDHRQREELLANLKGNTGSRSPGCDRQGRRCEEPLTAFKCDEGAAIDGRQVDRVCESVQRPCGSPPCRSPSRTSTPPRCGSSTGSSVEVRERRLDRLCFFCHVTSQRSINNHVM